LKFNAEFDYINVPKDQIFITFETNMLRIKFKKDYKA